MPAFYEGDSVTPKGQESLDRVEWRQQLGRPDPSVGELRAGAGGRDGFSGLLPFHRTTAQGETGSRLLFAFGRTVTHPLDKCHKPSLSSPIHQLHPCVSTGRSEALIPCGAPSWGGEQKSLLLKIGWARCRGGGEETWTVSPSSH